MIIQKGSFIIFQLLWQDFNPKMNKNLVYSWHTDIRNGTKSAVDLSGFELELPELIKLEAPFKIILSIDLIVAVIIGVHLRLKIIKHQTCQDTRYSLINTLQLMEELTSLSLFFQIILTVAAINIASPLSSYLGMNNYQ